MESPTPADIADPEETEPDEKTLFLNHLAKRFVEKKDSSSFQCFLCNSSKILQLSPPATTGRKQKKVVYPKWKESWAGALCSLFGIKLDEVQEELAGCLLDGIWCENCIGLVLEVEFVINNIQALQNKLASLKTVMKSLIVNSDSVIVKVEESAGEEGLGSETEFHHVNLDVKIEKLENEGVEPEPEPPNCLLDFIQNQTPSSFLRSISPEPGPDSKSRDLNSKPSSSSDKPPPTRRTFRFNRIKNNVKATQTWSPRNDAKSTSTSQNNLNVELRKRNRLESTDIGSSSSSSYSSDFEEDKDYKPKPTRSRRKQSPGKGITIGKKRTFKFKSRFSKYNYEAVLNENNEEIPRFKCSYPDCPKTYTTKGAVHRHLIIYHKSQGSKLWTCKLCSSVGINRQFQYDVSLSRHIRKHHRDRKPEICTVCGQSFAFTIAWPIQQHYKNEHGLYKCISRIGPLGMKNRPFCSAAPFPDRIDLYRHQRAAHRKAQPEKPRTRKSKPRILKTDNEIESLRKTATQGSIAVPGSSIFQRIIAESSNFQQTEGTPIAENATHTSKPPQKLCYPCKFLNCQKILQTPQALHRHQTLFHNSAQPPPPVPSRTIPCTIDGCSKKFKTNAHLKSHLGGSHSGQKPYQCDQCGKVFPKSHPLKLHVIAVHSGTRPFICNHPDCPGGQTAFARQELLRLHIQSKHENNPVICEICGKTFSISKYLRAHLKTHK